MKAGREDSSYPLSIGLIIDSQKQNKTNIQTTEDQENVNSLGVGVVLETDFNNFKSQFFLNLKTLY